MRHPIADRAREETVPTARDWIKILAAYRAPSLRRSLFELMVTLLGFFIFWGGALWSVSVSLWLAGPLSLLASAFLVRLFLIQHDCSHGAFFASRNANNRLGRVIGVLTMTPYALWQRSHNVHHATHGNLAHRGVGDVFTLTVAEYAALPARRRWLYRLYRHPLILFGLGPSFVFMLHHRLPIGFMRAGARYWVSTMGTNLALACFIFAGGSVFGWGPFLLVHLSVTAMAATAGVWLFYVQHQFEETLWDPAEDWQLHEAALYGSTYYVLPKPIAWITAYIGIHHVHHLYSRIPFYRLPEVLRDHPELAGLQRLTFMDSLKTIRFKLWNPDERRMVGFGTA